MSWWQSFIVAISSILITKIFDDWLSARKEKREATRKEIQRLEEFESEISFYFEIFSNYRDLNYKEKYFVELHDKQFILLSKINKHKELYQILREFFHNIDCLIDDLRKSNDNTQTKDDFKKSYDDFVIEIIKIKNFYQDK